MVDLTAQDSELGQLIRDPATSVAADAVAAHAPERRLRYVPLHDSYTPEPVIEAEATIAHGWWANGSHVRLPIEVPVAWNALAGEHRSRGLFLHCWDPMAAPLAAYAATGVTAYLRWCVDLALDWAREHSSLESEYEFPWYDMAVGLRAARLAYLIPAGVHSKVLERPELITLAACVRLHLRALAPEDSFAGHSNHGIYQAAGQLAASTAMAMVPEAQESFASGTDRIARLITRHFDAEGAHHEHSPGYHLMVLRTLVALRAMGLIDAPDLLERIAAAEEAASWLIAPRGTVPTVGDSHWLPHLQVADDEHLRHPALRFALTRGQEGAAPEETFRVFQEAGYVVARDEWARGEGFERASYLLQCCGFHSRVHKHADDLSFVWWARGVDLLTDPGRFGYPRRMDPSTPLGQLGFYYDDPSRIYVESTRSHNALEIDDTSYPRRGVPFYGSAIRAATREPGSGVVGTDAHVVHFDTVEHARRLFHRPGEWTLVVDHAEDRDGQAHAFAQRFQFGPELDLVAVSPTSLRLAITASGEELEVTQLAAAEPITPIRGQTEPELQGFVSRHAGQLEPSWSAGWRVDDTARTDLATLLIIVPEGCASGVSATLEEAGTSGEVRWELGGMLCTVRWWSEDDGRPRFTYAEIGSPDTCC